MEEKEKTKSVLIELPLPLYKVLAQIAKDNERTVTAQVRMILRQWYDEKQSRLG